MRKPRKTRIGAEYHVVARANRGEFILKDDAVKQMFLDVVEQAKRKYRFTIRNFCIMGNHIHLMITPGRHERLSRIMQWILSVFALRFNRKFGLHGHVWYDRFKSKIIGDFRQFVATFLYIAENPVRAHIVAVPEAYRYSGIRHIRDGDFSIVDPDPAVTAFVTPSFSPPLLLPSLRD